MDHVGVPDCAAAGLGWTSAAHWEHGGLYILPYLLTQSFHGTEFESQKNMYPKAVSSSQPNAPTKPFHQAPKPL